jgi:hypothetical protein
VSLSLSDESSTQWLGVLARHLGLGTSIGSEGLLGTLMDVEDSVNKNKQKFILV